MRTFLMLLISALCITPVVSYAQSQSSVGCTQLTYNLALRSSDSFTAGDVTRLQRFLISKGYLSVEPSGYFGVQTYAAVKRFQGDNGLLTSGYVGPVTRAKIKVLTCGSPSAQSTQQTTTPTTTSASTGVNVSAGNSLSNTVLNTIISTVQSNAARNQQQTTTTNTANPAACPGTYPSSMSQNPPFALVGVQWHQDFRFTDPYHETYPVADEYKDTLIKLKLNFNWLMEHYGSEVAFSYMYDGGNSQLSSFTNFFRSNFDNLGTESARIVNTYGAGGGNYGPTGTAGYLPRNTTNTATESVFSYPIWPDSPMYQYGKPVPGYDQNIRFLKISLPFPTGGYNVRTPSILSCVSGISLASTGGTSNMGSTVNAQISTAPAQQQAIPDTCYGRKVVAVPEWTETTKGEREGYGGVWFIKRYYGAHIVGFKTANNIYNGEVTVATDGNWPPTIYLSSKPCDVTTAVLNSAKYPAILGGVTGGTFRFVVAPATLTDSRLPTGWINRLEPNRFYYINVLDDVNVADLITTNNGDLLQGTQTVKSQNPRTQFIDWTNGQPWPEGGYMRFTGTWNPSFIKEPNLGFTRGWVIDGLTTLYDGSSSSGSSNTGTASAGTNGTMACPVFAQDGGSNCMNALNYSSQIKPSCCPNGTITSCVAGPGGVTITGINCGYQPNIGQYSAPVDKGEEIVPFWAWSQSSQTPYPTGHMCTRGNGYTYYTNFSRNAKNEPVGHRMEQTCN